MSWKLAYIVKKLIYIHIITGIYILSRCLYMLSEDYIGQYPDGLKLY